MKLDTVKQEKAKFLYVFISFYKSLITAKIIYPEEKLKEYAEDDIYEKVKKSFDMKSSFFYEKEYVGYVKTIKGHENLLYIKALKSFKDIEKNILEIFSSNIIIAFENLILNTEIINTQKEMILTLGGIVETHSNNTANHVNRVAEYSKVIAKAFGMNEDEIEVLKFASLMHDVEKIGIADDILNKPGKLSEEEFEKIKKHTVIGYELLKNSEREILKLASEIAYQHHERWDGKGYPRGLKGKDINIYARITAIADVFDALTQKRIYKEPWSIEKVIDFIKEGKNTLFDGELVELFLENIDEILDIKNKYKDKEKKEI